MLACRTGVGAKPQTESPITAFIRLDPAQYQQQVADTLKMLRAANAEYQRVGYEVESVRITTQPFPQFIAGMSDADALAWFRAYDDLFLKESFDANIRPAMQTDNDDLHAAELLAKVLSETRQHHRGGRGRSALEGCARGRPRY
jgi:hypothetical protein